MSTPPIFLGAQRRWQPRMSTSSKMKHDFTSSNDHEAAHDHYTTKFEHRLDASYAAAVPRCSCWR